MAELKYPTVLYRIALVLTVLILVNGTSVTAQDAQFSQFYAAPLYLNPAFAGSTGQARVGVNYRDQWPAIAANFTTFSAYGDYNIEDKNSGVGFIISHDREGILGLTSTSVGLIYSYDLKLTKKFSFRPGFQASVYNRSISFADLTFGNEFNAQTGQIDPTKISGENLSGQSIFFPDISLGGLFYSQNAWLGASAFHITQPNQSVAGGHDPLPIKVSVHGGYKFFFTEGTIRTGLYSVPQERSIAPVAQYRHQGQWDQMDVGMYFTWEPLVLGLWYRGIPFREVNGFANNESLVLLIGITKRGPKDVLNIGYSYDYTVSKLGPSSGGAHEFSISYSWSTRDPRKPPKDKLIIPCPKF
jgi:type IX secretion system PorP/SprF family membrane protein